MNMLSNSASTRQQLPKELLRDARADYRMCVTSGLLDATTADWRLFLAGYADNAAFYVAREAAGGCRTISPIL
jgi:hypothetical protein